ncbi:MAG TPA: LPS export ABC transporter periplasmic protein LptC [Cytophagales bacterium]|nr:LPS export ABC transporter periplasmic protein LptC [Cytophagales bacterium]
MRYLGILFLVGILMLSACSTSETTVPVEYEGPLSEAENVKMQYAEKDRVKVILTAAKILEFANGDEEFPEGIFIEFYDELGNKTSTLRANDAYFFKQENKWRGRGNVEVINTQKQEQLNTEELFWTPTDKKIFTEKFVTIKLQSEVLYGTGFEAKEDLSDYRIKDPSGDFTVDE